MKTDCTNCPCFSVFDNCDGTQSLNCGLQADDDLEIYEEKDKPSYIYSERCPLISYKIMFEGKELEFKPKIINE